MFWDSVAAILCYVDLFSSCVVSCGRVSKTLRCNSVTGVGNFAAVSVWVWSAWSIIRETLISPSTSSCLHYLGYRLDAQTFLVRFSVLDWRQKLGRGWLVRGWSTCVTSDWNSFLVSLRINIVSANCWYSDVVRRISGRESSSLRVPYVPLELGESFRHTNDAQRDVIWAIRH